MWCYLENRKISLCEIGFTFRLWDNSPDYEIKLSNLRYSAMAVSVSTIVADLRTVITQLVDDLDGLHAGVSRSSLATVVWGT